ncbi:hypothetical protein BD414DRAFT_43174 [Trametes punicea]|nr:hypothetical protein BD414DRAFT_43174 [Trametes punicea]
MLGIAYCIRSDVAVAFLCCCIPSHGARRPLHDTWTSPIGAPGLHLAWSRTHTSTASRVFMMSKWPKDHVYVLLITIHFVGYPKVPYWVHKDKDELGLQISAK